MTNLLIADDHNVVRHGIKNILEPLSDMKIIDEASTGMETIEKILNHHYDAVILDISLPDRSGLEILKQIKEYRPNIPVLIFSIYPEEQYAIRVIKAGAAGYLQKDSKSEDLISAIRKIVTGRKYITANLAEKLALELEDDYNLPLYHKLSDREYQVLCLIASGHTVSEIADELSLSVKTISTNRSRILNKLHFKNNAQLICYAVKNHLVYLNY